MNLELLGPEIMLVGLALALLLMDCVVPAERRRLLGLGASAMTFALFLYMVSAATRGGEPRLAFGGMFVQDGLSVFFKALFLLAGSIVLALAVDWVEKSVTAVTEYFVLILLALVGMLLAASANHFAVLYVALELVTVTFYILTSYQRSRAPTLEAGVKYLILGALSSAFTVYGIALCFGASGTMSFATLAERSADLSGDRLFQLGMLMVLGGLAFKVSLFPFHVWAPDVYEASPTPTTAFLAIGSKAAGVVLLVRLLGGVLPDLALKWEPLLMAVAGVSILYGSLCAIPQRSLKRLLGYSSIANGGFLMIGLAAVSKTGSAAVLFYLAGYLFTVLTAFLVVAVVVQQLETDDIAALSGLHQRSPLLAAGLLLAMVSLAGVPPLAGFFGKFLVLKALLEQGASMSAWYVLGLVAVFGVVVSFWYYFGVVRAMYWGGTVSDPSPLRVPRLAGVSLTACMAGIVLLGVFPAAVWDAALSAVRDLRF